MYNNLVLKYKSEGKHLLERPKKEMGQTTGTDYKASQLEK
jgi:hypothetical protein